MRLWRQGPGPAPAVPHASWLVREQRAVQDLAEVEASDPGHWNRPVDLASALDRLAGAQASLGKFNEAVINSRRAVQLVRATPVQPPFHLPGKLLMAAQCLLLRGDVGEAEVLALEVQAIAGAIDDVGARSEFEGRALELLVAVHFAAGDLERAETAARRRMDFADERRIRYEEGGQDRTYHGDVAARVHLGQIRLERHDRQDARRFFDDALEVIDRFHGPAKRDVDCREFKEVRRRHNLNVEEEAHSYSDLMAEERAEIEHLRNRL